MKPLSSITIFLCSSSRRLFTRTPPLSFLNYEGEKLVGISHFSTSSPDSSASSSYHSSSRRNSEDVRNVRVSVWWDFENCSVPCNVNVYKVTQCITAAVRAVGIKGPIQITAFGDVLQLSRSNQEALSSTGINLTHIPHGGKNSADRSLLVDLMYWVSQNPPPAHLFLISGDRDFASILHRLRMNNYNILLASKDSAPAVLCSAASIMWQWPALVKGENLSGKHFNQPPDGPYASWYGHYRVPLEDPFAVSNQVSNQTSSLQPDDVSDSNSDPKPGPVPKAVVNVIRNIMNSYPKGLTITDLRSELGKSNVTLEKDLYGHKKFSRFLMAMPYLLRLQSGKDGQFVVHGVNPKSRETSSAKDSVPVVAYKEDGGQNPSVPSKEYRSSSSLSSSSSSKLYVPNLSTDSLPLPEKQKDEQQVEKQSPVIEKSKEGEVNRDQLYPVKMKRHTPEVGIFKSIWRKWFKGNDGNQDKISVTNDECSSSPNSTHTVNANANSKDQSSDLGKLSSLSTNEEIQDAENVDKLSKPHGIFSQIVGWCKFWENDKNSDILKAGSSKIDKEIPSHLEMQEIFTESFWNDMLAFLETSKSSASILQSKTRQEMAQKLQKFGPSQLQSLTESHVLDLVNLLISEKKWIAETPSLTFPFKLVTPSKTKPSNSKEPDGNSQGQERKTSAKKVSPKTRSQILSHCQKLVNEVIKEHPNGFKISSFKKLFLERYGYPLEVQQLGYQKLSTLLQIMPGVKVELNYILPSGDHFRPKRKSEDENDTKWEELGPISKKDYDFESVSDNDSSDLEEESFQKGKTEENSSLLQILDSWYSNREDDDVAGVKLEEKQKPSKRYSFVTDKPKEEKENLINGILVSLKKQGNNGSPESKVEG